MNVGRGQQAADATTGVDAATKAEITNCSGLVSDDCNLARTVSLRWCFFDSLTRDSLS